MSAVGVELRALVATIKTNVTKTQYGDPRAFYDIEQRMAELAQKCDDGNIADHHLTNLSAVVTATANHNYKDAFNHMQTLNEQSFYVIGSKLVIGLKRLLTTACQLAK